jgi:1-acyl-sn-glycerol-3-phosphate acyltransferase
LQAGIAYPVKDSLTTHLQTQPRYDTPADLPRHLFDRLSFNTRLYFQTRFVALALSSRQEAVNGTYDTGRWIATSHVVFRLIEQCGGRIHIDGLENVRNQPGPVVFLSNHMSTLETMVFPGLIAPLKEVTFVVKDALVRHRIFGPVMRSRNPIVLSRHNPREDFGIVMEQGTKLLGQGTSIIIFPQSTRKVEFNPEEFNSIGTKLAAKAGVPVIPVAIKTDFWGYSKYLSYLGPIHRNLPVHISFGEPIAVTGNGKETHQRVIGYIQEKMGKW